MKELFSPFRYQFYTKSSGGHYQAVIHYIIQKVKSVYIMPVVVYMHDQNNNNNRGGIAVMIRGRVILAGDQISMLRVVHILSIH